MATLIDNPSFASNEVYQIAASDNVEGDATGASFGGIGIDNQPHQQLANRTSFLKGRRDTNIGNISSLLAFMGKFVGSIQPNGYLKVPIVDVARGSIVAIVQWGVFNAATGSGSVTIVWPIPFPAAALWASATILYAGAPNESLGVEVYVASQAGLTPTNGLFTLNGNFTPTGFTWIAIGF